MIVTLIAAWVTLSVTYVCVDGRRHGRLKSRTWDLKRKRIRMEVSETEGEIKQKRQFLREIEGISLSSDGGENPYSQNS